MKRWVMLIVLLMIPFISATYSGVRPAYYVVNFKPGYSGKFTFNFVFEKALEAKVYVSGNLSEYVTLDKDHLKGSGTVTATLNLPERIDKPGTHRIRVGVRQMPEEGGSAISLVADVGGIIKVIVPFPGRYLESSLSIDNVNVGQNSKAKLVLKNLGKENVSAKCRLEILSKDKTLKSFDFGEHFVATTGSTSIKKDLKTDDLVAGDYVARSICDYGGERAAISEQTLRVGRLFVNISGYTKYLKRGGIQKFSINATSFWNDDLKDVYGEGWDVSRTIRFKTPSAEIKAWATQTLVGYIDLANLKKDAKELPLTIRIVYGNKTTSKNVVVKIVDEKTTGFSWWWILLILIFLAIIIFIIYKRRKKDDGKKSKKH